MSCENPLNIASTPYVDCVVTTVSGHLQEQIDAIAPDAPDALQVKLISEVFAV